MMRILFIGMPEMGVTCLNALCEAKKNIVGVILPPKNNMPIYDAMKNLAQKWGLDTIEFDKNLDEPDFLEKVKEKNADIEDIDKLARQVGVGALTFNSSRFLNRLMMSSCDKSNACSKSFMLWSIPFWHKYSPYK